MNKEYHDIVILTPGSSVTINYVKSLSDTLFELSKRGITWKIIVESSSNIYDLRQNMFNKLKEENFYKSIWIDSDISWTTEDFLKIFFSKKEIITGCYLLQSGGIAANDMNGKRIDKNFANSLNKIIEIDSCGFGFICIDKVVIDALSNPFFRNAYMDEYLNCMTGEDISFCLAARAIGFNIWLDGSIKLNHYKNIPLKWRENENY